MPEASTHQDPYRQRMREATDYARLSLVHPRETAKRLVPFDRLPLAQQTYVTFRARGYSIRQAAEQAEKHFSTCGKWEKQAWYRAALEERYAAIQADKVAMLIQLQPAALATLAKTLTGDAGITATRLAAAQYVLDHLYGRPTTRAESHNRSEIALISPDDVLAALDRVQGATVIEGEYLALPEPDDAGDDA